jgi:hypothetical protein
MIIMIITYISILWRLLQLLHSYLDACSARTHMRCGCVLRMVLRLQLAQHTRTLFGAVAVMTLPVSLSTHFHTVP